MTVSQDHEPSTGSALEWRPIETAPRDRGPSILLSDGVLVLIGGRSSVCTGEQHPTNFWHTQLGSGWNPAFEFAPTHWMQLPDPPSSAEQVDRDSSRDTQNPSDLLIEHKRRAF